MGETTRNKGFVVNENGEIVRNRRCPKCGKSLFSEGEYCEYCGAKINGGRGRTIVWLFVVAVLAIGAVWGILTLNDINNKKGIYDGPSQEIDSTSDDTQVSGEESEKNEYENVAIPNGYVNLGLPSGTCWKEVNEPGLMTYMDAVQNYGQYLPTKEQMAEICEKCKWSFVNGCVRITGPNGNYITLSETEENENALFRASYLSIPTIPDYNDYRKEWEMCLKELYIWKSKDGTDSTMHISTRGTINQYRNERKNTKWGVVLCQQVKELAANHHDDRTSKTQKKYTNIYSYDGVYYCDGTYLKNGNNFNTGYLRGLDLEYFRVTFSFMALSYEGVRCNTDVVASQYPLTLSSWRRSLMIRLHNDGSVFIETNGGNHRYETKIRYTPNQYCDIDLEYYKGWLTINGQKMWVEMDTKDRHDNAFHSINYSSGNSFKGYLKNVKVYNVQNLNTN